MDMPKTFVSDMPVDVKPRRMNFPFKRTKQRHFFDNNVLKSAFWAALSSTFPAGEKEFIDSVRLYKERVKDPKLQEQIQGFIGQEGQHSGQHTQFNRQLKTLGFDAVRLEKHLEKDIKKYLQVRDSKTRLAMTVGMEHITAIMADHALNNPEVFDGMDDTIRQLLLWHSVEEIEHKAVAFDVYMLCEGDREFLHKMLKLEMRLFTTRIAFYMIRLLWWSKTLPRWRDIKDFYRMMFGKKGIVSYTKPLFRDYFREDFHPWDHKNQKLVDMWKDKFYNAEFDRGAEEFKKQA